MTEIIIALRILCAARFEQWIYNICGYSAGNVLVVMWFVPNLLYRIIVFYSYFIVWISEHFDLFLVIVISKYEQFGTWHFTFGSVSNLVFHPTGDRYFYSFLLLLWLLCSAWCLFIYFNEHLIQVECNNFY